jgi:hypothetical protein
VGQRHPAHVAGVDEAGLSPLAGPASAAASFPVRVFPALMIQKKLNAAERERLAAEIKRTAVAWSVGFADVSEKLAVKRALEGLLVRPGHVLVDGRRIQDMKIAQQPIPPRFLPRRPGTRSCTFRCETPRLRICKAQGLSRAGARCSGGAGCMFHSSHLIRAGAV